MWTVICYSTKGQILNHSAMLGSNGEGCSSMRARQTAHKGGGSCVRVPRVIVLQS